MDDLGFWASCSHALPASGPIISFSQVVVRMTIYLQQVVTGVALNNSPTQMNWGGFHEHNAFFFLKLGSWCPGVATREIQEG